MEKKPNKLEQMQITTQSNNEENQMVSRHNYIESIKLGKLKWWCKRILMRIHQNA